MTTQTFTSLFECCCCFGEVELNQALSCSSGHISCSECLERALQIAVGDRKVVQCFHRDGCEMIYSEVAIRRATEDLRLRKAYNNVLAVKNIEDSGIENAYSCPFCDNVVCLDDDSTKYKFFHCHSCNKTSCRICSEEKHEGSCVKDRRAEEEATDNFLLICICNRKMFRGDGCNHLTCQCRRHWCWICKSQLFGNRFNMYSHFGKDKCPQVGERKANQKFVPRNTTHVTRHRIDVDADKTVDLTFGGGVVGYGVACQEAPRTEAPQTAADRRLHRTICRGVLKGSGLPCNFKARRSGFCGFHKV